MGEITNIPSKVEDSHDECSVNCWCGPKLMCAICEEIGDCFHGAAGAEDKAEVIVHKEAS